MGSLRTKEDKEWYVLHQFICKVPLTREVGLPEKRMGKVHSVSRALEWEK